VSLRYFNVAGALHTVEGLSYGERHGTETHLIPNALRAALGSGAELRLFGTDYDTPDGTCVRDYLHVVDLGEAHLAALTAAEPGRHHVINLGSGTGYSVREVLTTVSEVTGRDVPVVEAPRRAGDPARLVASNARALELLGWTPTRDLQAMVADAYRFEGGATGSAEPAGPGIAGP
jgi:UDP-glucose 4-epimerase